MNETNTSTDIEYLGNQGEDDFIYSQILLKKDKRIEKLEAELAALREAERWIPVSERLPEEGQTVIVYISGKGISTPTYQVGWKWCYETPTHWRPLPPPPTVFYLTNKRCSN
jgi:hypothetical protein